MKRIKLSVCLLLLLAWGILSGGCTKPPAAEREAAKKAMDVALSSGADKYAVDDWEAARKVWDTAESQVKEKKYKEAKESYINAKVAFEKVTESLTMVKKTTVFIPDGEKIEVRTYIDKESAGWAYKKSDIAFFAEKDSCRIQWNVTEHKHTPWKMELSAKISCPRPFNQQVSFHRAIFKEIFSKWDIKKFDMVILFGFGRNSGWSWSIPLAIASWKSEEYKDYKRNYPNSKIKNINELFVKLANESDSYREFRNLFKEFGVDVQLNEVEKVFAKKAEELPFYSELKSIGIHDNPMLMYDNHLSSFKIKH